VSSAEEEARSALQPWLLAGSAYEYLGVSMRREDMGEDMAEWLDKTTLRR
jgi:hypothetical protein